MSQTKTEYVVAVAEPTFHTPEEVWKAAGDAYRSWRRAGHSEDSAARDASEFYAHQMARLHERQIETVCAWCHRHISGPVGADPKNVSHGICPECLKEKFPEKVTA